MTTFVQSTINAIRDAVEKRISVLKKTRAMASSIKDRPLVDECRGGIDELELLIAHFPSKDIEGGQK